jgi:hypothetical protein
MITESRGIAIARSRCRPEPPESRPGFHNT